MKITPKGWSKFQHYKHRSPPWIRLHRDLLNNYDFACLPVASKALAPCLWLLASESVNGEISLSAEAIAFRLHMQPGDLSAAISPLITAGFFDLDESASSVLAACKQSSPSETETETEAETEKSIAAKKPSPRAKAVKPKAQPSGDHAEFIDRFDALFLAANGARPTWGARQGSAVGAILRAHGLLECLRRAENMFSAPPPWPPPPHDLGTLAQHFDRFAAKHYDPKSATRASSNPADYELVDPDDPWGDSKGAQ